VLYLGVVPGVADGEGPVVGEDLEEAAGDGDGLLLGHLVRERDRQRCRVAEHAADRSA